MLLPVNETYPLDIEFRVQPSGEDYDLDGFLFIIPNVPSVVHLNQLIRFRLLEGLAVSWEEFGCPNSVRTKLVPNSEIFKFATWMIWKLLSDLGCFLLEQCAVTLTDGLKLSDGKRYCPCTENSFEIGRTVLLQHMIQTIQCLSTKQRNCGLLTSVEGVFVHHVCVR